MKFRDGTPGEQRAQARANVKGALAREYTLVRGLEHLRLAAGQDAAEAARKLSTLPFVEYAEPDYAVQATMIPNDPLWSNLWGMGNIRAPVVWDSYRGDPNMVIAIIDTGIDYNHSDLAANIWTNAAESSGLPGVDDDGNGYIDDVHGYDFAYHDNDPMDRHGHGTHTAGTTGAVGNNGLGVTGVNWQVQLMAVKFLDDTGNGSISGAIEALQYVTQMGVKVSNNSWGGGGFSQAMVDALAAARAVGHLFIAAAGNGDSAGNGLDNDRAPFYPASYNLDNIISVAAINSTDAKATFSNYGSSSVDLGAPGVDIYSTYPGSRYAIMSGTSMATPHVTGAAAMLFAKNPGWTYTQVRDRILATARPVSALRSITVTGGVLDLSASLAAPPAPIHVDSISLSYSAGKKTGRVTAQVKIVDANLAPVSSATVSGTWYLPSEGKAASAVTGANGVAVFNSDRINYTSGSSVQFCVTGVSHSTRPYLPGDNRVTCATLTFP